MKIFAVRLNADPRVGRPYSVYPTMREYKKIHGKAVGNGFHEAVNFREEAGKVRGYLPPKPARELQEAETFTLVSMTYKGDVHKPDRVFGIQSNCRFVGATKRVNQHIENLDWHFVCEARDSILFPEGIDRAFAQLIGENSKDWYRGGPTKRIEHERFLRFIEGVRDSDLERRTADRFRKLKSDLLGENPFVDGSFDEQVAAAMKTDLRGIKGNLKPTRRMVQVLQYDRDPQVVAFALKRAKGRCESCKSEAPFLRQKDGTPYLEVHHIKTLAAGGPDTPDNALALCPNCHRKSHFGKMVAQE